MSAFIEGKVTWVHHWTDRLFSFRTTRDPAIRFLSGQFAMIGLMVDGKPLVRAYSMACAAWAEELEFFSIKVQDGPLTSRLQHVGVGDTVLIGRKPTGTLIVDNLLPGRNLYFLATGTGLAPFLSLIREPAVYEKWDKVVVLHGVRDVADLAYRDLLEGGLLEDELIGEMAQGKLVYVPCVSREDFPRRGRITDLLASGALEADPGLPPLDPAHDRAMVCGSPAMLRDFKALLESRGFEEGSMSKPGTYVVERAFAES
jgi:ferredoxin--NADP+ reductase